MRVILADTAGFCMGVRRALRMAVTAAGEDGVPLCTYGPLIHNKHVLSYLESLGVREISTPSEAAGKKVLVRAHGVTKEDLSALRKVAAEVIDATCPRVVSSERFVEKKAEAGFSIIIVGDRGHAEVTALQSRGRPDRTVIISSLEEAETVETPEPIAVVAQTTFNLSRYERIIKTLEKRFGTVEWLRSVCMATEERQSEVRSLAGKVDAVVVVGDKRSANTGRLAEIAAESGKPVFRVETASDLPLKELAAFRTVGVTAGASTPAWIISDVTAALRSAGSPMLRLWEHLGMLGIPVTLLALAASALTQAVAKEWSPAAFLFCAGYFPAAYGYNRLRTGRWPMVEAKRGRLPLLAAAAGGVFLAAAAAVWAGATGRRLAAGVMGTMLVLSLSYPVRLPCTGGKRFGLRDLPGMKDLFVALGWMTATWAVPFLLLDRVPPPETYPAGLACGLTGFIHSVYSDARNVEEDRLLGKETLASMLGKKALRTLLTASSAAAAVSAVLSLLLS